MRGAKLKPSSFVPPQRIGSLEKELAALRPTED
jgi:hypothetical protein